MLTILLYQKPAHASQGTAGQCRLAAAPIRTTAAAGASRIIAQHSVAIALCIMFLSPFVFIVLTSFMSSSQSLSSHYWPHSWHPGNYLAVFRKTDMPRYLWNTVLYAGLGTIFTIASSVPAAYALAKLRWPGRKVAFLAVICMMLLPPQITAVPLYSMWAYYGLTGTLWPLILPSLFGDAFSIFLLRQFLLTIPNEYVDAAKVDGCGELRTLLRVVVPMASGELLTKIDTILDGVVGVHDLHAWTITSGLPVLSAHVVVDPGVLANGRSAAMLDALQACLHGHFDVGHSTFQLEPASHAGHEPSVCL